MMSPESVVAWVMLVGMLVAAPPAFADGVPTALRGSVLVWFLVSGAGNVGGLVLVYNAMRIGQVSLIAPLISTEGSIAAVISVLAGESLSPPVGAALALTAVGVCLAAIPSERTPSTAGGDHPAAVGLAVLATLSFGVSLYATGRAGMRLPASWVVLSARLIGVVALALPLIVRRRLELAPRAAKLVVASGICEVLGFYSYTVGARRDLAVAAVLASEFAVFVVIGAYVLFKERLGRVQLAGVSTVLVGVAVLAAARA